jgi:hypothetical protein
MDHKFEHFIQKKIIQPLEASTHELDFERSQPPYITNSFSFMRKDKFSFLNEELKKHSEETRFQALYKVVKGIDNELLPRLIKRLQPPYLEKILQKHYNVPKDLELKEVKSYGAITELNNLAESIAAWSLELEASAFVLESLHLYGVMDLPQKKVSYLDSLKEEFKPKSSLFGMGSVMHFLFKRILKYTCMSLSKMAFVKGVSQITFDSGLLMSIGYEYAITSAIPWNLILQMVNLPWLLGGVVASMVITKAGDYYLKQDSLKRITEFAETLALYTEYLTAQREAIVENMLKYFDRNATADQRKNIRGDLAYQVECLVNSTYVDNVMKLNKQGIKEDVELHEDMFTARELDDYVLIEERKFIEVEDEGFIVVKEKMEKSAVTVQPGMLINGVICSDEQLQLLSQAVKGMDNLEIDRITANLK